MGNGLAEHVEVEVGGPLDEARLRGIVVRALRLRNWCSSETSDEVTAFLAGEDRFDRPAGS